ncbi:MAG: alpha/beta fold hydrolase [Alphaproteobacteria bacterium]
MATYVLIHGSFQGGWIWQPTAKVLRDAGHLVYAPSSDGCAERQVNIRAGITVTAAGKELASLLFHEDLRDVVLVATSSGGLIVEKAAVLARDRIQRLVFIDALVPQPGESVKSIVKRPAGTPPYQMTEFTRGPTKEDLETGLFGELTGTLKAWAIERATPHPLGLSDQTHGELDEFWTMPWKAKVIYCRHSPNPGEAHQRRTAERLGAPWIDMDAGHYPMLTHAQETARLIQEP